MTWKWMKTSLNDYVANFDWGQLEKDMKEEEG